MATLTKTDIKKGGTIGSGQSQNISQTITINVDIAKFVADGGVTTDNAIALSIPARSHVAVIAVTTATALSMGSAPAVSVGDNSSATLWVNAASTVTKDASYTIATTSKTYMAADVLNITLTGGTLASGVVQIVVRLTDISYLPTAFSGN